MNTTTNTTAGIALIILSVFAMGIAFADSHPEHRNHMMHEKLENMLEEKGVELPDDWKDLSKEEREEFFEENDLEDWHDEMKAEHLEKITELLEEKGLELPENWDKMTHEEHQAFLKDAGIDHMKGHNMTDEEREEKQAEQKEEITEMLEEKGIDMPEDWDEMTQEERHEFLKEAGIEREENKKYQDATRYKGMTVKEAQEKAEENDVAFRVVEIDGVAQAVTMDFRIGRINASVEDNIVVSYRVEGKKILNTVRKSKAFKKYAGEKKEKKNFYDKARIKNQKAVDFLQERGIINGYADGSFKPNEGVNRAAALKMAFEAVGNNSTAEVERSGFTDVDEKEWFAPYIARAKAKGYVKGYADGKFRPGNTVNKAELLKIAFQIFEIDLEDFPLTNLPSDVAAESWYAVYFAYAVENELIDLEDGKAVPTENMTRDEFSEVIYRLVSQQEEL